jgi:hypothetical protein
MRRSLGIYVFKWTFKYNILHGNNEVNAFVYNISGRYIDIDAGYYNIDVLTSEDYK